MTRGLEAPDRFAPLVGHYPAAAIAIVAGVQEWLLPPGPGSGKLWRWQPEEDAIVKKYPDAVSRVLLPWRTRQAIRSRRRDLGRRNDVDAAALVLKFALEKLRARII